MRESCLRNIQSTTTMIKRNEWFTDTGYLSIPHLFGFNALRELLLELLYKHSELKAWWFLKVRRVTNINERSHLVPFGVRMYRTSKIVFLDAFCCCSKTKNYYQLAGVRIVFIYNVQRNVSCISNRWEDCKGPLGGVISLTHFCCLSQRKVHCTTVLASDGCPNRVIFTTATRVQWFISNRWEDCTKDLWMV